MGGFVIIEISTQEAWKVIDAIKAYPENYSVSDSVIKMFKKIQKDLEKSIKDENLGVSKPAKKATTKRATAKKAQPVKKTKRKYTKKTQGARKVSTGK